MGASTGGAHKKGRDMSGHLEGSPFTGAYYRKVESPPLHDALGIRAFAILPEVSIDPDRFFIEAGKNINHFRTGPLDRPSFYLGGNSNGKELDAGLCWDRVYLPDGTPTFTDRENLCDGGDPRHRFTRPGDGRVVDANGQEIASGLSAKQMARLYKPNFAFRPYYRTTNHFLEKDETLWNNPKPGTPSNVYFYPGERVVLAVRAPAQGRARLDIRSEDHPEKVYAHTFRMEGFGLQGPHRFKRVNAIDQFLVLEGERHGNERRAVIPTRARSIGGQWTRVELLDANFEHLRSLTGDSLLITVPQELLAFVGSVFQMSGANDDGGEVVSIDPTAKA